MAIKDLANVKGFKTTEGSPLYSERVARKDDQMVARLRAAGALFIGKTNTPEFGLGSNTFNPVYGKTKNPYDLTRHVVARLEERSRVSHQNAKYF